MQDWLISWQPLSQIQWDQYCWKAVIQSYFMVVKSLRCTPVMGYYHKDKRLEPIAVTIGAHHALKSNWHFPTSNCLRAMSWVFKWLEKCEYRIENRMKGSLFKQQPGPSLQLGDDKWPRCWDITDLHDDCFLILGKELIWVIRAYTVVSTEMKKKMQSLTSAMTYHKWWQHMSGETCAGTFAYNDVGLLCIQKTLQLGGGHLHGIKFHKGMGYAWECPPLWQNAVMNSSPRDKEALQASRLGLSHWAGPSVTRSAGNVSRVEWGFQDDILAKGK